MANARRRAGEEGESEAEVGELLPAERFDALRLQAKVREALDRLSLRERELLLLRAEGYSYRDLAAVLELHEASVGTLLARAKRAFEDAYEEVEQHAP